MYFFPRHKLITSSRTIEMNIGITCACLPTLNPIFHLVTGLRHSRFFSWSSQRSWSGATGPPSSLPSARKSSYRPSLKLNRSSQGITVHSSIRIETEMEKPTYRQIIEYSNEVPSDEKQNVDGVWAEAGSPLFLGTAPMSIAVSKSFPESSSPLAMSVPTRPHSALLASPLDDRSSVRTEVLSGQYTKADGSSQVKEFARDRR